jgi:ribosome-associated protein
LSATEESIKEIKVAAAAANEEKATDIVAFDVSEPLAITDAFLIASGDNPRQVIAIAAEVEKQLYLDSNIKPRFREGLEEAEWVLLDYGDFVIHLMDENAREFYALEKLWADCPSIDLDLKNAESSSDAAEAKTEDEKVSSIVGE